MKKKFLTVLLALAAALCLCFGLAACGEETPQTPSDTTQTETHTHLAEQFQMDDGVHWKVCTVCGEKFSVANHDYNFNNACKTCGYSLVYTKGLKYVLNAYTDTYLVTGIGEATDETELMIPAYYEGKAVTSITNQAFKDCSRLMRVVIPGTVTVIGDAAFRGCSGLKSIVIPNSVTLIGSEVFYRCSGLTGELKIPDSVTSIGDRAFYYCSRLTGELKIPDSVTSIGDHAFYECSELTSVTMGSGVTEIGDEAFYGCSGLTSVTMGSGVTVIGEEAFMCCGLTVIQYKGTVKEWQAIEKGDYWDWFIYEYTVVCTDGTVDKKGNVTYFH